MKIPSPYSRESKTNTNFYKVGAGSFHQIQLYLDSMDELLEFQKVRIVSDRKKQMKKHPQEWQLIEEFYERDVAMIDVYFKRILLNSAFNAAFATFESVFKRVCHRTAYKYSQQPVFDSGPGIINKYRNYLVSILRDSFSSADQFWQQILRYSELRNSIAHHGSVIQKKDAKSLVPFLKKQRYVTVKKVRGEEEYRCIITDKQFIIDFLTCVQKFIHAILWELPPGRRKKLPYGLLSN